MENNLKTFEDLECWKSARELKLFVKEIAKKFPSDEKYKLTDQIIRASRSIGANIAEGYGRYTFQECKILQRCKRFFDRNIKSHD